MSTRSPDPAYGDGQDRRRDASLEHQVLDLVRNWMRKNRELAARCLRASTGA